MKTILYVVMVLMVLAACQGKDTGKTEQEAPAATLTSACLLELKIEGMTCTGCENTIKGGIGNLPGIAEVSASFETGLATVRFDSTLTSIDAIKTAVADRGYQVISHQMK